MTAIPVGMTAETLHLVTLQLVTDHLGTPAAQVLATPILIGLLEKTARDAVTRFLDAGQDTVGTDIRVRHLAAAPLGMQLRLTATVTSVAGRRICYRLTAHDEAGLIAEGEHERTVIEVARFAVRAAQRLANRPR